MKKFLTFMMILITVMGMGFAAPPAGVLHSTSCNFTFVLDAADIAKTAAGFFKSPTVGSTSIEKMADLDNKTDFADNIVYKKATGWDGVTNIYAIVGTNWAKDGANSGSDTSGGVADIKITLNPFVNENDTGDKLGYTVNCVVATNTGHETVITGTESSTITVETGASKEINVTGFGAKMGGTSGGEEAAVNGLLEIKFSNMVMDGGDVTPTYKPTVWQDGMSDTYKAVWTMTVTAV